MDMDRRMFLQALAATPLVAAALPLEGGAGTAVRLIAHRGGVVDDAHPENSPASLEAAVAAGYWMVEVDVRRTRDGYAILQHDRTFQRAYGDPRNATDMDWSDIKQLRTIVGHSRPMRFEELAERCKGRMRLMLDVKNEPNPPEYYRAMEKALVRNELMGSTYILSDVETEAYFNGRLKQAASIDALQTSIARGEPLSRYYLFDGAEKITNEVVALARSRNVDVVGAANIFAYKGSDAMARARSDLKKGYDAGVRAFQIDSVFHQFFLDGFEN